MAGIPLRPYQEEAVQAIIDALTRGIPSVMVVLPTGSGKTICFSEAISRIGGTALILAHREELLTQAAAKIATVAPELSMSIGFVQAGKNDVNAPVVVASVPTLARESRLKQLPQQFDLVVVDECHHATADSYRRILDHVDAKIVVGVTATPERADEEKLGEVFPELIYARSIEQMIEDGYLVDLVGRRVEIAGLDLRNVKRSKGDWQAGDLGRAIEEADGPAQVAATMRDHAAERKSIVFVPTVEVAHHTAASINKAGIPAAALDGTTPSEERAEIIRRLSTGELRAVVNVGVLTEGFDEPSVDCVVMACPTQSRVKYVQCVGRALRLHPGKENALVLDLVGVSQAMKLQSLPDLFELEKLGDGETVTEAKAREEQERFEREGIEEAAAVARRKRKAEHAELFDRNRMNWQEIEGRWTLTVGEETFALDPHEGAWRVLQIRSTGANVITGNLDLGYAMGAAEESIRRDPERLRLARQDATWRGKPATEPQRKYLVALGAWEGQQTRGEASDAIARVKAAKRLQELDAALERQATEQEAIR